MYLPAHFREDRLDVLHEFIERHPLGRYLIPAPGGDGDLRPSGRRSDLPG
jgi:predicted FMN-binding regulatory protein PaiB